MVAISSVIRGMFFVSGFFLARLFYGLSLGIIINGFYTFPLPLSPVSFSVFVPSFFFSSGQFHSGWLFGKLLTIKDRGKTSAGNQGMKRERSEIGQTSLVLGSNGLLPISVKISLIIPNFK